MKASERNVEVCCRKRKRRENIVLSMAEPMCSVLDSKIDVCVHRSIGNADTSAMLCQNVERAEKCAAEHDDVEFGDGSS